MKNTIKSSILIFLISLTRTGYSQDVKAQRQPARENPIPNFYEAEFVINPGELSRVIYNIHGYWYETRTQIRGLPAGILEVLDDSIHKRVGHIFNERENRIPDVAS